ncbi:chromatin modification- protein VID21 [Lobaria immixta]|nr:chromatin modification- protein VID21 [Lobaria immixta]
MIDIDIHQIYLHLSFIAEFVAAHHYPQAIRLAEFLFQTSHSKMPEASTARPPSPLTQNETLGRALLKRKSIFGTFINNRNDYFHTHVEPGRPIAHWDMLLAELKWMQTDFKMERGAKMYHAQIIAQECLHWWVLHRGPPIQPRRVLQLKGTWASSY